MDIHDVELIKSALVERGLDSDLRVEYTEILTAWDETSAFYAEVSRGPVQLRNELRALDIELQEQLDDSLS